MYQKTTGGSKSKFWFNGWSRLQSSVSLLNTVDQIVALL